MVPRCLSAPYIHKCGCRNGSGKDLGTEGRSSKEAEAGTLLSASPSNWPHPAKLYPRRGAGCGSCIIPSVQSWSEETRSPWIWAGQGQGAESQKWKGPVDNRPVRQVCTVPFLPGHDFHPQCPLNYRQLTAMTITVRAVAARSQYRPGNVPQLQMHEPMTLCYKSQNRRKTREAAHGWMLPRSVLRSPCPP